MRVKIRQKLRFFIFFENAKFNQGFAKSSEQINEFFGNLEPPFQWMKPSLMLQKKFCASISLRLWPCSVSNKKSFQCQSHLKFKPIRKIVMENNEKFAIGQFRTLNDYKFAQKHHYLISCAEASSIIQLFNANFAQQLFFV